MTYDKLELHLSPAPLSRSHAKRIKAAGGKYSECRSHYASKRFVTVPASERGLIDELVRTYRNGTRMTVVARAERGGVHNFPAWVVVQYVNPMLNDSPIEQFERRYAKAYDQAVERGIIAAQGGDNA